MRAPATTTTRGPALGSPPWHRPRFAEAGGWLQPASPGLSQSLSAAPAMASVSPASRCMSKHKLNHKQAPVGQKQHFLQENSEQGLFTIKSIQKRPWLLRALHESAQQSEGLS